MKLSELIKAASASASITPRKILIYGEPKSGKTELYGSLAGEGFNLHIIDGETSVKTFLKPESKAFPFLDKINVYPIPDTQVTPIFIETILKVMKGGQCAICYVHGKVSCPHCTNAFKLLMEAEGKKPEAERIKHEHPWSYIDVGGFGPRDVLVIETYSQLAESAINWVMHASLSKDDFDAKAGWDEYGKMGRILERVGSNIQSARYNVIVVSHAIMVEMEDKQKKLVPIGGTSNASKVFAKYFDDVVYTEVVNGSFRAYCNPAEKFNVVIGSRSGKRLLNAKKEQLPLSELFK